MAVVRLVLAVVLGMALIAVSLPAIESVRTMRAETAADTAVSDIRRAMDSLTQSDPTADITGARRALTVTLPQEAIGRAAVEWLAIGGVPNRTGPVEPVGGDVISYQIAGVVHVVRLTETDIRIVRNGARREDRIPLRITGDQPLYLSYRIGPKGPLILVSTQRLCPITRPGGPCSTASLV